MLKYIPSSSFWGAHIVDTNTRMVVITFFGGWGGVWVDADLTLKEMLGYLEAHRG